MTLSLPVTLLQHLKLENKDLMQSAKRTTQMFVEIDHRFVGEADRRTLLLACSEGEQTKEKKKLKRQLKSLIDIAEDPAGAKVQNLGAFKDAATDLFKKLPNKRAFVVDGALRRPVPYFVERVNESGSVRFGLPHVTIELTAVRLGKRVEEKVVFYYRDIRGKTLGQILDAEGICLENEALNEEYQRHIELYQVCSTKLGEQFTGNAWVQLRESENSWQPETYHVPADPERPAQLVMDHWHGEDGEKRDEKIKADESFWEADGDGEKDPTELPEQPLVYMYDLQAHEAVIVHVADITPHEYQPEVGRLLILPPDEKRLLDILRQGIRMTDKDVIHGKTGGCLIIIQGEPGVGKTLSAQVFSEQNKRPLYEIQCAQLGIQPNEVEKNLREALLRARRWNAVLLINEADVFVHTRGTDIVQNAIVGVFLRLLESLDGVCFLTTNKGTIIDDAIYSRAIVHLKYDYPDKDGRNAIFTDQAKLQGLQLPADVARALADKHKLSGRDIRKLIKLAKLLHLSEGNDITLEDMEWSLRWRKSRKNGHPSTGEQAG